MPVKRRASKRRNEDPQAWDMVFQTGHDFFGEVQAMTGLVAPNRAPMGADRKTAEAAWRDAAREAWHRFGPAFLATFQGDKEPWALVQFGRPWEDDPASRRRALRS